MPSNTFKTVLTIAALASTGLGAAIQPVEKRDLGSLLAPFLAKIFGYAVFGDGPNPCLDWAHTNEAGVYFYWGQATSGAVFAGGCFTNDTTVDNGGYDLHTITQDDVDVANCLTNLHFTQQFSCITVAGSECDLNGYSSNGGVILNSRIPAIGSSTASLSADQSSAAQGVFNALIGTTMIQSSDMPSITFYDNDQGNYQGSPYPGYQLNMASGGATTC